MKVIRRNIVELSDIKQKYTNIDNVEEVPCWLGGAILSKLVSVTDDGCLHIKAPNYSISEISTRRTNHLIEKLTNYEKDYIEHPDTLDTLKNCTVKRLDPRTNSMSTYLELKTTKNLINPEIFYTYEQTAHNTVDRNFIWPDGLKVHDDLLKYWTMGCATNVSFAGGLPVGLFLRMYFTNHKKIFPKIKDYLSRHSIKATKRCFNKDTYKLTINHSNGDFLKYLKIFQGDLLNVKGIINYDRLKDNVYFGNYFSNVEKTIKYHGINDIIDNNKMEVLSKLRLFLDLHLDKKVSGGEMDELIKQLKTLFMKK
jgi:hypothetical protein